MKTVLVVDFDAGQIRKLPLLFTLIVLDIPEYSVYDQPTLCNCHVKSLAVIY